jgi:hypothetical protein
MSKVGDSLYEVLEMRVSKLSIYGSDGVVNRCFAQQHYQASTAIESLLRALWHAEFLCHYDSYRIGIILLADVGLEFGMSKRCRRILDEIMPQVSTLLSWLGLGREIPTGHRRR